jgi:hypothetical protein
LWIEADGHDVEVFSDAQLHCVERAHQSVHRKIAEHGAPKVHQIEDRGAVAQYIAQANILTYLVVKLPFGWQQTVERRIETNILRERRVSSRRSVVARERRPNDPSAAECKRDGCAAD